jgi:hypothetical protein
LGNIILIVKISLDRHGARRMNQPPSHTRHRSFRPAVVSFLLPLILFGSLHDWRTPELRGAPAAEPTSLAYLPLIARAGPTTTVTLVPTSTPTPTTTASPTPTATVTATPTETPQQACRAVYPIGLNAALFNDNGFIPPTDPAELPYYGIYNDATYTNKTQRRMYRTDSFATPGYVILQWDRLQNAGSVVRFAAAMTGTGTLAQGFEEVVPWPDPNSPEPPGYPLYPGQLTVGDWITGSTGNVDSSDTRAALQYHIDHKTVMSLPIVDRAVGNGQNAYFHHAWLGDFLLRGFSLGGGTGSYLDLVYLGGSDLPIPVCP